MQSLRRYSPEAMLIVARSWVVTLAIMCSGVTALAQPGTFEAEGYFEGLIQYSNKVSGEAAEFLRETEANTQMDLILKDGHFIIHMIGGQLEKTLLYNADSNWTYVLDPANERVFIYEKHRQRVKEQPKLTPTNDSVKVMGIWCHGYSFTKPATKKYAASTTTLYIHPKYRVNLGYYPNTDVSQAYWTLEGLDGCIPLKIVFEDESMRIENTAFRITPMKLKYEQFKLPEEWKVLKWDYRR